MHPDASRLFAGEASLRAEADAMLAASGIGAILAGAGYTAVGSYAMRTMTRRDLDFERAEEPDWARQRRATKHLERESGHIRPRAPRLSARGDQRHGSRLPAPHYPLTPNGDAIPRPPFSTPWSERPSRALVCSLHAVPRTGARTCHTTQHRTATTVASYGFDQLHRARRRGAMTRR
jgi:hypothetical protein